MLPKSGHEPTISVVMPVHNALPHLDRAIRSILDQSVRDFEFIIFDDASTDGSTECLREWAERDERIRFHVGDRNLGPAASSNRVASLARGELVARMDADDVSHPDRLRRQAEVLGSDEHVGLVASLCEVIDANGRRLRGPEVWRLTRQSSFAPFPHGSIMYRRRVFEQVGGYRAECEYWEDQDLWLRMAAMTRIVVIPEALYQHRQSPASNRVATKDQDRVEAAVDLMYSCMGRAARHRSYEDLLHRDMRSTGFDPRVFVSLGSLQLWAGGRPRLFRRALRRAELRFDAGSLAALVWTAWASASPASLRAFLGLLFRARNAVARKASGPDPVAWSPPKLDFGSSGPTGATSRRARERVEPAISREPAVAGPLSQAAPKDGGAVR